MTGSWRRGLLGLAFLLVPGLGAPPGNAGELRGKGTVCDPSAAAPQGCNWVSTKCTRPQAPMLYVASSAEFNRAATALNKYASDLNAYLSCVGNEAQGDLNAVAATVRAGADKAQADSKADFDKQKSQLEAARLRLQLQ